MKERKIIHFPETLKRRRELTGHLCLPLRIGNQAWISCRNGLLTTSLVEIIWEVSETGIIFETANSIYYVTYLFPKTEVISA